MRGVRYHVPGVIALLVLASAVGVAQGVWDWGPWPTFLAGVAATVIAGTIELRDELFGSRR